MTVQQREIRRMVRLSVIIFTAMWYAVPYSHEAAHYAVCAGSGHEPYLYINPFGEARAVLCSDYPDNLYLLWASGGLAGLALSGAVAFSTKHKILFIAAFPYVPMQALQVIMETFVHGWYVANGNYIPMVASSVVAFAVFIFLLLKHGYAMKNNYRPEQRHDSK